MRILFIGSGGFALPTLECLLRDHDVAAVVTQPARKGGRGRQVRPTPVQVFAEERGVEAIEAPDVNEPGLVARLTGLGADIGVVVAFGQKLEPPLLACVPAGFINLHASLLPRYRGAAPYQWAVLSGEEKSGVTVFRLTPALDAGPILAQRWTFIKPAETAAELHDRLARIGPDAMKAALEQFGEGRSPDGVPQDLSQVTRAPKLKKEDGAVDFSRSAESLARFVCGMWSWPGASCVFEPRNGSDRERVVLARARVGDDGPADVPSGELDVRLFIATGVGWLELLEIRPAGGRVMTWQEYVNGRHVRAGDRFTHVAE